MHHISLACAAELGYLIITPNLHSTRTIILVSFGRVAALSLSLSLSLCCIYSITTISLMYWQMKVLLLILNPTSTTANETCSRTDCCRQPLVASISWSSALLWQLACCCSGCVEVAECRRVVTALALILPISRLCQQYSTPTYKRLRANQPPVKH
jgi:hypothetical protein